MTTTPRNAELLTAERLVSEFEDIFGDISATERKWLVDGINRLAAKPDKDGVRNLLSKVQPIIEAAAKGYSVQIAAGEILKDFRALSTTGEPKPTPISWIDAEEGDMS